MSRYINAGDLHNVVMKRKAEYGRLATLIDNIVEEMVYETPSANVIEKAKINRAIERMKNIPLYAEYTRGDMVQMCIDILKEELGEGECNLSTGSESEKEK